MCGIAGFLHWGAAGSAEAQQATIRRMGDVLRHRGPDHGSSWCDASVAVALAHRRLAILDVSPAGHQPMKSADGRFVMVFNGEIYNHLDVRRELERSGRAPVWNGHSDTETMLAAVLAWGVEAALQRFVGMFAFALWDREKRSLHLARDRIGEKPLYFGWLKDTFAFASELKALQEHPDWRGEIDRGALALLMRHNYVPAPYSIYCGIQKLLPGTALTLPFGSREATVSTYWSARETVERARANRFSGSPEAAVDKLEAILGEAIAGQRLSDVPLGAFLSGGVDSSTIVALMQQQSSRPVRSFSIGFEDARYNEATHAKAVARHLGTDHTELYVTAADALDVIPRLPGIYDEPFADSSQVPTYLVAKLARRDVTVALSGDGGDELFSGYDRYRWAASIWGGISRIPAPLRQATASGLKTVSTAKWNRAMRLANPLVPSRLRFRDPGNKLHRLASLLDVRNSTEMYLKLISHWDAPESLVRSGHEPLTAVTDPRRRCSFDDLVECMMAIDLVSYLPDDILVKVDRAAMAVSLETRIPLLDHRVVEFAWSLPQDFKFRDGQSKWILRQVLYKHVPRPLIERPKMGFGIPIAEWLRGPLRGWAEALLEPRRLEQEGFFDHRLVGLKWSEHLAGSGNWAYALWNVLMFQAWLEKNGQSSARSPDSLAA